jgi:hypothetical protein
VKEGERIACPCYSAKRPVSPFVTTDGQRSFETAKDEFFEELETSNVKTTVLGGVADEDDGALGQTLDR